ncbi:Ribbon-helix-helix protein, copG family [Halovivax ruber XH-70]|uniref:Ribbon-helix-helix protein, copG family n=1 Tax=Halovivax ruber (strain DSM 18193 / JCM 13892 / XH-70) TaxID=797302 RepID=L0I6A3_HALRX|nr:ribbon-helix-helix protein, CopG family [Halovivax ruber]AGB15075.1 Ribbon-helix-helix protein, copG family [Halovivax ruber XH-70]
MGNKNKTISFRVNEEAFAALQEIAEERDISLSAVFRDYVDTLIEHDGQVAVVPEDELEGDESDENAFPPTVEVPKSFLREHERLELETEHLREQLEEHKAYVTDLRDRVDDEEEEVLLLDDLDEDEPYQLG